MVHDRQIIRITLRLVAVLLITAAIGVIAFGPSVMLTNRWGNYSGHRAMFYQHMVQHVYTKELPRALPLILVAGILWILQKPLARLIVPKVDPLCSVCGYSLRGSKGGKCPECGGEIVARSEAQRNPLRAERT